MCSRPAILLMLLAALLCSAGCRRNASPDARKADGQASSPDRAFQYRLGTLDSASPEAWTVKVTQAGLLSVSHETADKTARHSSSHFLTDEETENLWKAIDGLEIEGRSSQSASGLTAEFTLSAPAGTVTLTLPASAVKDDAPLAALVKQLTTLAETASKKTLPKLP